MLTLLMFSSSDSLRRRRRRRSPPPHGKRQFFWARTVGGFLTGALCSGVLSLSAPCPRSSSCERCGALPGSRYFSEISPNSGKGDFDSDPSTTVAAGWRRADARWHLGLVVGLLVGGFFYGRGGLAGAKVSGTGARPALVACTVACSLVLAVAVAAWRRTGSRGGEDGRGGKGEGEGEAIDGCGGGAAARLREIFFRRDRDRDRRRLRRGTATDLGRRGGGGWRPRPGSAAAAGSGSGLAVSSSSSSSSSGGQEDEAPLLGDVSVHDSWPHRSADLEAGAGGRRAADGPVSAR